MTRINPTGSDGTAVVTGTPTGIQAIKSGAGAITLKTAAGASRGNELGFRIDGLGTDVDQANFFFDVTAAAAANAQFYFNFRAFPSAQSQWATIRSSTAVLTHMTVNSTGGLLPQNSAGTNIGSVFYTVSLNTWYRLDIGIIPATSTTGTYQCTVNDDGDTVVASVATLTNQNMGTTQPSRLRFGDANTTAGSPTGLQVDIAMPDLTTGASIPTVSPVAKNVAPTPPETPSPGYNRRSWQQVGGTWGFY